MVSGRGTIRRRQKRIYSHRLKHNLCSNCGESLKDKEYRNCSVCRKKIRLRVSNMEKKWREKNENK